VLLFFKAYECDRLLPGDRHLKRLVRPLYDRLQHRQKLTGFGVSFDMLRRALERKDFVVHVNDYDFARANPDHPVGLVGGPALLEGWSLPNPALLGPSLLDQPGQAPGLFDDARFFGYVCLADWMHDLFEAAYPGRCFKWFAGIDTDAWPDLSGEAKDLDFLIYDKVRWEHDYYDWALIAPICDELEARGLTYDLIRYRRHDHAAFKAKLARASALLFLCENETQGIAYQEAMACNVPVLAWDRGYWADPQWRAHFKLPPPASSVPFFSPACGERFVGLADFPDQLETFMRRRDDYRPRDYVIRNLDLETSARLYAGAYFAPMRRSACGASARPSFTAKATKSTQRMSL
jgi:glycosyltransferase involved in cell wall biosynthesis